jgi:hypothetical protein
MQCQRHESFLNMYKVMCMCLLYVYPLFLHSTLGDLCKGKVRPNFPESWKMVEELGEEEMKERDDKIYRRAWSPKRTQWDCETILSKSHRHFISSVSC